MDQPMPAPSQIVKTFPKQGDMQQFRLAELHEFTCERCGKTKKSKPVVFQDDDWTKLLCNGCYGLLLSKHEGN